MITDRLKILILEDKKSDAELVVLQLEDLEYRCEFKVTDKKEEYIQLLSSYQPDLIISDFNLPRFDGMKALEILRKQDDLTPFIFVTGTMGEENAVEAIRSGATDFIIKQRVEQLPSAVLRALREKQEKKSKKRIAKQLADSEQNYKSLFHLSPLPMWVFDQNTFKFLKVNEAAIKHYGYSQEEFHELTVKDIRPKEDIPLLQEAVNQTKHTGTLFRGIYRHQKKNGEIIQVEVQSTDINLDGAKARLVVVNDITEKQEAEDLRKKSEQRFKALVQEGSDLIGILDLEGKYLFASDSTNRVLGVAPEYFIGKAAFDFVHPEDISMVYTHFSALKHNRQVRFKPFRFRIKNDWKWFETTATNLCDDPAVEGIVINSRDITKNIEQEQELKLTNERYQLAALATNDAIYDWDPEADVIMWGEGIFSLFGHPWNGQKTTLNDWVECIHSDDYTSTLDSLNHALADPAVSQWRMEYRMAKANGHYSHALERGYIIRDDTGKAVRMIGAVSDVSETVEREMEQRLLAGLSHTLGQPGLMHEQLETILELLKDYGKLDYAEAWLTNIDHTSLNLIASTNSGPNGLGTEYLQEIKNGMGLPGEVWRSKKVLVWTNIGEKTNFLRKAEAVAAGIVAAVGMPVIFYQEVIGVLLFMSTEAKKDFGAFKRLLTNISTRLGAELQRKKSEVELNRFFDISPDLLCIAGLDGYYKKVNPAFSKLTGFSEHELLTTPYSEFIHPEDRISSLNEIKDKAAGVGTRDYESRFLCKDKSFIWLSWTASPSPEEKLLFAVAKDVTERKKAEIQLLKTNQQLKTAQQIAKIGYWKQEFTSDKGEWSDEIYAIWEMDAKKTKPIFENFLNAIHPEDQHLFSLPVEKYPRNRYREIEHRVITPKGKEKWIFHRITLVVDDHDRPVRLEGVAQDITEKKKLEKEREAILESITDGFFAVDKNWTVTYWNKAAEDILKIPKERILQKNLWDVFEAFIKIKSYEEYHLALQNQEVRVFERHYITLGIWVEISIFPKGDGLSVYVKDISERKQHQYEIFKTVQETQEKERARFGRDMHDGLTQSLTAIKMNLTHFKHKLDQGEIATNTLNKSIEYINNSIQESRVISHGLLSITLESYGLLTALREIVENTNANNKLHMTFNHNLPEHRILTKELEINIYRIVQEAISNILKHSKATEAKILLVSGAENIQLIINDNGTGIKDLKNDEFANGAGLRNIKVRADGFDGEFQLLNKEEGGLQINISFPRPVAPESDK